MQVSAAFPPCPEGRGLSAKDSETLVRRAGRQHATLYPDPVEAAKAAAWAGDER